MKDIFGRTIRTGDTVIMRDRFSGRRAGRLAVGFIDEIYASRNIVQVTEVAHQFYSRGHFVYQDHLIVLPDSIYGLYNPAGGQA